MNRRPFCILSVIALILMQKSISSAVGKEILQNKTDEFDIFVLAQRWPQTSCWDINRNWKSAVSQCSPCILPNSEDEWTLHGLWPSNYRGRHPSSCNPNITYKPDLIRGDLRMEMTDKWPTLKLKSANDAFWNHEWEKHGTCALKVESTNSISKYFSKSLELMSEFKAGEILANANVVPGKFYLLDSIMKAFNDTLNVAVLVRCTINKITKNQYLEEVHICFDRSFKLVDCDQRQKRCKRDLPIKYPKSVKVCSRDVQQVEQ